MSAFSDRTVIVRGCGAQASMAHAVAAGFAAQGANIVAVGPHVSVNDYARSLAVEADAGVMALRLAHEDTPAVRKAVQDIVDRFGRIDVLVNCSLVARAELLASTRDDDLERTFATCAIESFAWMRECRPHLAIAHGSVINFGSRLAMQGQPGFGMLAAAVEGLAGISRVAAREWADDDINVNIVCAQASTAQFEHWVREFPDAQDEALSSLGRDALSASYDGLVDTCLFLAGETGHHVSGQVLEVS